MIEGIAVTGVYYVPDFCTGAALATRTRFVTASDTRSYNNHVTFIIISTNFIKSLVIGYRTTASKNKCSCLTLVYISCTELLDSYLLYKHFITCIWFIHIPCADAFMDTKSQEHSVYNR